MDEINRIYKSDDIFLTYGLVFIMLEKGSEIKL